MSAKPRAKTPAVTAKLIRIGNSRGVRLPKELIEQAGLTDEVELIVRDGEILIANHRRPRQGWAEAYDTAAKQGQLQSSPEERAWQAEIYVAPELLEDEDDWWEK